MDEIKQHLICTPNISNILDCDFNNTFVKHNIS